jgi:hypothetical protein
MRGGTVFEQGRHPHQRVRFPSQSFPRG